MVDDGARNGDAARLGQLLQPCRDIDAIAIAIVAFDNHVAEIDPDAQVDATILGKTRIALSHSALHDRRALDCLDDASELCEQSVAHQLEDAALMLGNLRLDQLFAIRAQAFESPRLILFHEPAIADHIGGQDGSKAALGAFLHHVVLPSENAVREIVLAPRRKVYRAGLPRWVKMRRSQYDKCFPLFRR